MPSVSVRSLGAGPTFSRDVAPILFTHCAGCHQPDGPAPFSVLTFDSVRRHATPIALATASGAMPPWKADTASNTFVGQDRLAADQIALIRRWVDEGAPEGDPRDAPAPPASASGWQLGPPDLVISAPSYTVAADGAEVFRIFAIPIPIARERWVKAFEFRPGNAKIVHHANLRIDATPASRTLDAADPLPGYDGLLARSAVYPDGYLLGWTPGQVPQRLPDGLAWGVASGTDFVAELHMKPTGRSETVAPSIGLYFTDTPPAKTPSMLRLGRQTIDIPAGDAHHLVSDTFTLPVDVDVIAVQPHAHDRGREMTATATRPDGSTVPLIHIPDWDVRWQQVYRYVSPPTLPKGTTIAMRYRYDNSPANPRAGAQPRRVRWGQRSSDEMGDLWLQVMTRDAGDRDALDREFRPKMVAEDLAGASMRIAVDPADAALRDDAGLMALELRRYADAVGHFAESLRLQPQSAAAEFNLGTALNFAGRLDEAVDHYRRALAIRPSYAVAHNNLGAVLLQRSRTDEAAAEFRAALQIDPQNADARANLARLQPAAPTFTKDIAPIVWSRCTTCHRPGQVAPFSLITYDDVKRRASLIGSVIEKRLMPPWKPVAGQGDFADARRLTDAEFALLRRWIADGAPEGDRALLPPAPTFGQGWQLGTPDVVVTMPVPYVVPADGGDVFRTFVVPIATERVRFVRALEFRPDNARVVHHANLGIDRTKSSRALDARDAEPGYSGSMVQDARYPEGQLLGWTPGQAAHAVPDGMQWRLEPGSDLVMQLHLQPTGKRETLAVSVGLYFTDAEPTRTPLGLRLGSETIDIPAGAADYVVQDRYVLPVDVDVIAIQPHAHNLGRRMQAGATLPDGRRVPLIAIDDWDFRWQDVYRYAKPIALPRGTTIAMQYTYDNSAGNPRNPHQPPARILWGQNTTDEMGDLWIQMTPHSPQDFAILNQDFRRKAHAEDLAAYSKLLQSDPDNPLRHDAVAALYFEDGRLDEAIDHYGRSLRLNAASAATHYNIGIALAARSRRGDAIAHFEQALRLDPGYAQAHNNLGALLYLSGRPVEALDHYRKAIALRPDNVEARTNLAALLSAGGRPGEALEQYRGALAIRPDDPKALAGAAWIRATATDPALRNGDEAVTFAERAAQATSRRDLGVLDALAAAYAEVGRFDDAVATAEAARRQASESGMTDVATRFGDRTALYRQRRPYRMPVAPPK